MILTSHVAVGIATAELIENPALSWPTSFGLHFLFDLVPHWDALTGASKEREIRPWRWVVMIFDIVLGLTLGLTFVLRALWFEGKPFKAFNILGACFFSILPDLIELPYVLLKKHFGPSKAILKVQQKLHWRLNLPWGLFPQLLVAGAAIFLALTTA
ncbi:MAG: hypothetical protein ABH814_02395 [bacterium]